MRSARTSRYSDSTMLPLATPRPPKICTASSITRWAASVACSFAIAASLVMRRFCTSRVQAAR